MWDRTPLIPIPLASPEDPERMFRRAKLHLRPFRALVLAAASARSGLQDAHAWA